MLLLNKRLGLPLREAKKHADTIFKGVPVFVEIETISDAAALIDDAQKLGAFGVEEPHIYPIQNDGLHFYTGLLPSGRPVLMGVQRPELVLVEFDKNGGVVQVVTHDSSRDEENTLRSWQTEIGLQPGTIFVCAFFLTERWIGIHDLPDHYQDALNAPQNYDAEERDFLQNEAALWKERGDFVLYWNEDYYLNRDGVLESS